MSAAIARLMDGHRKLVGWLAYVCALLTLALFGVESQMAYEALTWGFAIYVGGNAAEHMSKRPGKASVP